jgi:hypothetical protein
MKPRGQDEQKFGEGENPPRQVSVSEAGSVFISYRRQDSADITGRIYDRLVERFGTPDVFKDVDTIPLGVDFRKYLQESVSRCDVLLAIIGKNWLEASITRTRGLDRFTLRGKRKVNTQWLLYCIVHNIGKIHRYAPGCAWQ